MLWLSAIYKQVINWANVDADLRQHTVQVGHIALNSTVWDL